MACPTPTGRTSSAAPSLIGWPTLHRRLTSMPGPRPNLPPAGPEGDDPEWGPIRLGALPPAEPFPLDVLPEPARALAKAAAWSIACPIDFPAVATLAAASGLIGRSASLLVKPGYFAPASLYLALVGGTSSGKSPSLRAITGPLVGVVAIAL